MRPETVHKSVRLTKAQLDYVESRKGRTFTEKISNVLDEARKGEKDCKKELVYYENLIENRRKELASYNDLLLTFSRMRRDVMTIERRLHDFKEGLSCLDGSKDG